MAGTNHTPPSRRWFAPIGVGHLVVLLVVSGCSPLASSHTSAIRGDAPLHPSARPPASAAEGLTAAERSLERGGGPAGGAPGRCVPPLSGSLRCSVVRPAPTFPLPAASSPPVPNASWHQLFPSPAPGQGWSVSMVYDASDGYVLAFSGYNYSYGPNGEDWKFSKGVWTQISPTGSPGAHGSSGGQNLVYDPVDKYVVLEFGAVGSSPSKNTTYTWKYHALAWTNISSTPSPPGRWRESFAWDTADGYAVFFGGCLDSNCYTLANDTWSFVGSKWTNRSGVHAPVPLARTDLQYDPADGYLMLFGGYDASAVSHNETWEYRAGTWTQLSPPLSPPAEDGAMIAAMGAIGGVFLFGGQTDISSAHTVNWTWYYAGGNWTNLSLLPSTGSPGSLCCTMMTWDGVDHAILAFGGYNYTFPGNAMNETWELVTPFQVFSVVRPTATDIGFPVSFNATAGDGAPPYGYNWSFGDGGTSSVQNTTHTYTSANTFRVVLVANDSNGSFAWSNTSVKVSPPPVLNVSTKVNASDVGVPVTFSSKFMGGTAPYALTSDFGDGGSSNVSSPTHTYATAGSYNLSARGIDAVGAVAYDNFTFAVNPDVSVSVASNRTVADVSESVQFTASPMSGTSPYTTSWVFGDRGKSSGASADHVYASPGTYSVRAWTNDSVGGSVSANLTIVVHDWPTATARSSTNSTDVGRSVSFHANATGGTPPFAYQWSIPPGSNASGPNVTGTFATPGNYTVRANVTDATAARIVLLIGITVNPDPLVTLTPARVYALPNISTAFTASVAGGTPPFQYEWNFGDGSYLNGTSSTEEHAYVTLGTFDAEVTVNDSVGSRAVGAFSMPVVPLLRGAIAASTEEITLGQSVAWAAAPVGGLGPYSYAWEALPPGCAAANTSRISCIPSDSGNYTVSVRIRDAGSASATATDSVLILPGILGSATASASVAAGCRGPYTVNFSSSVSGGRLPYALAWSFGDGSPISSQADPQHQYVGGSGNYSVLLTVTDGNHATKNISLTAVVSPLPCPSAGGSGLGGLSTTDALLVVVGAIIVVGAIVAALNARRGRSAPPSEPPNLPPPDDGTYTFDGGASPGSEPPEPPP